jgi:hypothetical protein
MAELANPLSWGARAIGFDAFIRSAKQDDNYGASNIVLPCPGS